MTLTCGTADAKIYYTLDGSEPSAEKTLYSTPVNIQTEESSKTLKAVAIKEGMTNSDVLEVTYMNSGTKAVETNSVLKTAATKTKSAKKV